MAGAESRQLEAVAAGGEAQALGEADVGGDAVYLGGRVLLGDHGGRVGEDRAAGGVVAVAVAVDHVGNRLAEARRDFGFEPGGGLGVDRVGDDDAFGGDDHGREMELVLEAPDIAGDVGQFALDVLGLGALNGGQGDAGGDNGGGQGSD
jgi:hypothetical protein